MLNTLLLIAAASLSEKHAATLKEYRRIGYVDVRDFGACGAAWEKLTREREAEAVRYAEQFAREVGVPVRYCAKPNS